jgi:hypothetical protein
MHVLRTYAKCTISVVYSMLQYIHAVFDSIVLYYIIYLLSVKSHISIVPSILPNSSVAGRLGDQRPTVFINVVV